VVFRRKKTRTRRQGKPFQELFDDVVREVLESDPDLAKDLAFRSAGFSDILEKTTPEYKRMIQLENIVVNQAFERIKRNPKIMDRLIRQEISEIISGKSISRETDNSEIKPLIVDFMELLKKQVRERKITIPITRESLTKIIDEVSLARKSKAASAINTENWRENTQPVIKPESMDYPGINTPLAVGNNLIDPAEFVKLVKQEVLTGVVEAQNLWNFLLTANFQQFSELLRSFRVHRRDKECVVAINSSGGEDWVNKVIELVGQTTSEFK